MERGKSNPRKPMKKSLRKKKDPFVIRPDLMGGPFLAVAVKDGSSEVGHIDANDEKYTVTWIIPLGTWEGGDLCFPTLGIRVPLSPGQIFCGMMGFLPHYTAPYYGINAKRVSLTCFTDKFLMKEALRRRDRLNNSPS